MAIPIVIMCDIKKECNPAFFLISSLDKPEVFYTIYIKLIFMLKYNESLAYVIKNNKESHTNKHGDIFFNYCRKG